MTKICRICMADSQPMISLFADRKSLNLFQLLGGIDISQDEGNMQAVICTKCQVHLLDFATIRCKIQTVDDLSFQPLRKKLPSPEELEYQTVEKSKKARVVKTNIVGNISISDDEEMKSSTREPTVEISTTMKSEQSKKSVIIHGRIEDATCFPNVSLNPPNDDDWVFTESQVFRISQVESTEKSNQKNHKAFKSKSGQFKCSQCDRNFKSKTCLRYHVESAHEDIKYPCGICDKLFTRKYNRQVHLKRCKPKEI